MTNTLEPLQELFYAIVHHNIPAQTAFEKLQKGEWHIKLKNQSWMLNTISSTAGTSPSQNANNSTKNTIVSENSHIDLLLQQAHPYLQEEFKRIKNELSEAQMIIALYEEAHLSKIPGVH